MKAERCRQLNMACCKGCEGTLVQDSISIHRALCAPETGREALKARLPAR